jgi:cell shape-determining protein MreC
MFNTKLKKENEKLKSKVAELEEKYGEVAKVLGKYYARLASLNPSSEILETYMELAAEVILLNVNRSNEVIPKHILKDLLILGKQML